MKRYIALFEYDENGGYAVTFPDLPGCASAGDDYDDAYRMSHDALSLHLEGLEAAERMLDEEPAYRQA